MEDKFKTVLLWVFSMFANWLAWFELNADLLAKIAAVVGATATIILSIFHAVTLFHKNKYYKYKAENEKNKLV
jgi:hypothetical protein